MASTRTERRAPRADANATPARTRLGLMATDEVLLVLPPVSSAAGSFVAAWAALLVTQVRPNVRLVVPAGNIERERIRWLVESCRHEAVVRFAGERTSLAELLEPANLALFLPAAVADSGALEAAVRAGCPVIATAIPMITEVLTDGKTAWLCRPNSPADAARQILRALENPAEAHRRAEAARAALAGR